MYSEMYSISKPYSTQYCSFLAEVQAQVVYKRSKVTYSWVLNAYTVREAVSHAAQAPAHLRAKLTDQYRMFQPSLPHNPAPPRTSQST
jgi:hypothetical protein